MSPGSPLIVHVVYRFAVGGLENGVVNLINRLPPTAWRHVVLSLTDVDSSFAARIDNPDVRCIALGKGPGHAVALYPRVRSLLRSLSPAIVHTRNLAALELTVPAWAAGVGVRVHGEHGRDVDDLDGSRVRYQWLRRAFRPFVTRYVALSPDLREYLCRRVGIPEDRVEQIYNGVDTARFRPRADSEVPIHGCPFRPDEHWVVGTVGRMESVKDQTNLVHAFVGALRMHPDARRRLRLVLVGDGALRPEVERIVDEHRIRDLVWFAGEANDVVPYLQSMDCFVLPSLAEGVSNTILEAMACAIPVIATRVGANAELVEEGLTGRVVPRADSQSIAKAVIEYFTSPATARRHGRAGRQRVVQRFSLERMVEQYHQMYASLTRPRGMAMPVSTTTSQRHPHG